MKKTIANSISEKIKKGEITMRSQASIWAEKFGLNSGIAILFLLLCTMAGFILYWINSNNDLLIGGYGQYGISSFVQSFPYIFVIGFIVLFSLLIIVFRRFDFSYKKPFSIILFLLVIVVLIAGWVSIKQPIGQKLYQQEGRFFRMGMMNNSNAVSGIVTEINTNNFLIQNEKGINATVNFTSNTHFPFGHPKVDDTVRAIGIWNGSEFNAYGIRVFDENNTSTLGPGMMRGRGQGRGRIWNR